MRSVSCPHLDAAGNRGFSGAPKVPGADVWLGSETSRSLDPDGWLVRRNGSRRHSNENTDASEITNRGWSVPIGTQRKKCQKLWQGEVLPLDGSLLMGDFSDVSFQQASMRISGRYHMKVLHTQEVRAYTFRSVGICSAGEAFSQRLAAPAKFEAELFTAEPTSCPCSALYTEHFVWAFRLKFSRCCCLCDVPTPLLAGLRLV